MEVMTEPPHGDIGQLLRGLDRRTRKARRAKPVGTLEARVDGGGRVTRRSAVWKESRIPTGPRDLSATRTWSSRGQSRSSRFTPETERRFDTDVYGMRAIDDMDSGLRRLENDPDSVILAVHGMTRPIPGGLKGGYGVFVSGFAERLNRSGQLPYLSEQTAELAELLAALDAVKLVHTLIFTGQNISHVVIKTTSEYLVNGMADLVWIWAGREYNNSYGRVCAAFL